LQGKEFVNQAFREMLNRRSIQFYVSQNEDIKASVVERFNRTLKTKMWRYFTHRNTYRYLDTLQDFLHSYNHSFHRTIKTTLASVKKEDEEALRERMYGKDAVVTAEPKLKVGDTVRLSKAKQLFVKAYMPNWTEELFTVTDVLLTMPPTYRIKDYGGEEITGTFYEHELQRVVKTDNVFKVEKILKTRKILGGGKQYYVQYRNWPSKYNEWIDESALFPI
jgi:hypothetical protein